MKKSPERAPYRALRSGTRRVEGVSSVSLLAFLAAPFEGSLPANERQVVARGLAGAVDGKPLFTLPPLVALALTRGLVAAYVGSHYLICHLRWHWP